MTDVPEASAVAPSASTEPRPVWRTLVSRLLPWVSLGISVASAVAMDRSESRGGLIAVGSGVSWVVFVLVSIAHRKREEASAETTGALRKVLRFTTTAANQSLIQLSLFFCAPFYLAACAWTPLQLVFVLLFALAVAIVSWDPWCARALLHPVVGPVLLAFASFAAWNAALPMLGVPQQKALWLSAAAVAFAIPAVHVAAGALGSRRAWSFAAGLLVPAVLALGGVRALPPAPLRLVAAKIGTRVEARELVDASTHFARSPSELVCWTAVRAPHGLADNLTHEWRHDGELVHRVELDVRGGRRAGFRTWSRLPIGARDAGHYRCEIVTPLAQTLGRVDVIIGERAR